MELSWPSVLLIWLLPVGVLPLLWVYFHVKDAAARMRYVRRLDQ